MVYVGIDIAKHKHFAAVLSSDGEVLRKSFGFSNTSEGFSQLLNVLSDFEQKDLLIGMESTGHYGENLLSYLFQRDFKVCLINPMQTAALRKTEIRKTKTDKVDAMLVAKSLMVNKHRLYTVRDEGLLELKTLCRFYRKVAQSRARLKTQLVSYMDKQFPEYANFFKGGIHLKSSYALLKLYSAPDDIAALHLTSLTNLLRSASRGQFQKPEAVALKGLAKSSVGVKNAVMSIQVTQTIEQIEFLEKQLSELRGNIETAMKRLDSVILTVPGIHFLVGGAILGEIGDIRRFSKPAKLLAYAGLDPTVSQSGQFQAQRTKMSKRGSTLLRWALIKAAWGISNNNDTFAAFYAAKRSQGLSHYGALGHVAHKLVRVLFKLLTNNIPFDSSVA
jgi:transposase